MRIEALIPDLPQLREANLSPSQAVRLLAGDLPDLEAGMQIPATVLQVRGSATLLDLKGAQVLVDGLPNLAPGTDLSVRVTAAGPNPILEIAPGPRETAPPLPLTLGQDLVAQLLQQLPNGNLLINVNGVPLEASAPPGLQAGTSVAVQVVQIQPQVVLQILNNATSPVAQAIQIIRANLTDRLGVGESLQELQQALAEALGMPSGQDRPGGADPASAVLNRLFPEGSSTGNSFPPSLSRLAALLDQLLPGESPPTGADLANFVRQGGLQFEAHLAQATREGGSAVAQVASEDLKGVVLQALRDLAQGGMTQAGEELMGALRVISESSSRSKPSMCWPS